MEGRDKNGLFLKGCRPVGRKAGTQPKYKVEQRKRIDEFFSRHWEEFDNDIWPQLSAKEKKDTFIAMMNYAYPKLSSVDVKSENRVESSALELIKQKISECSII